MKTVTKILLTSIVFVYYAFAQSPVSITINTNNIISKIPKNFLGFSYGRTALDYGFQGADGYFFDTTDTQLLTIFRRLGIENLRIGGSPVDTHPNPSHADVDALFRFAKTANLRIIYSLRLENGDSIADASLAKYVWAHYKQFVSYFAVGNEPDIYRGGDPEITGYSTYLAKWRRFVTVIRDSVPNAVFGGPDLAGTSWYGNFCRDEANSIYLKSVFSHYYVNGGGNSTGRTSMDLANNMLSSSWDNSKYPGRHNSTGAVAAQYGLPYRLTEANSYSGGGPANIFASSLFSVDFLYWWALHGGANLQGINIHCNMDRLNTTIYAGTGGYQVYPLGYGIKAFSLGGHGNLYSTTIVNPDNLNITAYASGSPDSLYVTITNKGYGTYARNAKVTISATSLPKYASVMYLNCLNNNPTAVVGVKLNGANINNYGSFRGRWILMDTTVSGNYTIIVPALSAAVIRFTKQISVKPPSPPVIVPTNGKSNVSIHPILTWNALSGAKCYRLQVATDPSFINVITDTILSITSLKLTNTLLYSKKYYWHVGVLDSAWESSFSTPDSFSTIYNLPSVPVLVSPAAYSSNVTRDPVFVWDSGTHAKSYEFQMATDYHVFASGDSLGSFFSANVVADSIVHDTTLCLSVPLDSLTKYFWHLRSINENGKSSWANSPLFFFITGTEITSIAKNKNVISQRFELFQNYPNPFNPSTIINYSIAKDGIVSLIIYDILGRKVKTLIDEFQNAGTYRVDFDASKLAAGVYLYKLRSNRLEQTKKMLLIK